MVWSNDPGQVNKGKGYKVVNWLDWPAAIWDVDGAYPGLDCGYTQQPLLLVLRLILIFNRAAKYVVYSGPRFKQGLCAGRYYFNHGGGLSSTDCLPNISPGRMGWSAQISVGNSEGPQPYCTNQSVGRPLQIFW